jgi:hypothetical protein
MLMLLTDAAGPPRRKADFVTPRVDALAQAVDPAERERLINRFGPSHARLTGVLFAKADPEFWRAGVMFGQPRANLGGGAEEED